MVTPDEEQDQFDKDPRAPCKYGASCYQKNPVHRQKYKHPPKKRSMREDKGEGPSSKKRKEIESDKLKTSNVISESEDSTDADSKDIPNSNKDAKQESENRAPDAINVNVSNVLSESEDSTDADSKDIPNSNKDAKQESENRATDVINVKVKVSNAISESEDSTDEDSKDIANSDKDVKQESENRATDETNAEVKDKDNEVPVQRTPSSFDEKEFIKQKFLVDMPEDFYLFWEFCKSIKSSDPSKAFSNVGLTLVGPYDVLAGKFSNVIEKSPEEYLTHWRYYYDPPEFQTVLKGDDSTGYHIGYFRDHPREGPAFVASNHGTKDGEFTCVGDNIFAGVVVFLEQAAKSSNPFKKMEITKLLNSVKKKSEALSLTISNRSSNVQDRNKKILTRTFNKFGLVVPYNRKTQLGYRHLCCSDAELRKLLDRLAKASEQQKSKVMAELQAVFTATNIAIDECDFGTGIELGWDILAHGVASLNSTIERFLTTGYRLLQWPEFAKIATAHMKNRQKGTNLSIL